MNEIATFTLGLGIALAISSGVVIYLRPHLRKILVDLCGTESRADFWTAFSNVSLTLVPLICAMFARPELGGDTFFSVSAQIRWALIGLVVAVTILGLVLSRFIAATLRRA